MFGEEEILGINGKGEHNQQFHGFKAFFNFKICEVKILSNWLSNSSTDILRKNKQLQYCAKNKVAYKKKSCNLRKSGVKFVSFPPHTTGSRHYKRSESPVFNL